MTARIALLRQAVLTRTDAAGARRRLAALLYERDQFDAAAEALAWPGGTADAEDALLQAQILLARCGTGDAEQAIHAAGLAARRTDNPALKGQAQLAEARALLQLRRDDAGVALLRQILGIDPAQLGAFRTLSDYLLRRGDAKSALELITELRAAGQTHARLLGAESVALAQSGAIAESRNLSGIDRFVATSTLEPPAGWESPEAFRTALQGEAEADPDLRHGRHGTASRDTWRVDHPHRAAAPAFAALHQAITAAVFSYLASLPTDGHPWLAARPSGLVMRSWCVMTGAGGFEEWHNHPAAWMSGGYYAAVPDQGFGDNKAGSLIFGMPALLAGDAAATAFGEKVGPTRPGMLALFPSHAYHRTYPHGQAGRRICMAFDLCPA